MALDPELWFAAVGVAAMAGLIKGVVGFALPLIFISGLSLFLPPEIALAGLILPAVVTNVFQGMRQGAAAAVQSVVTYRVFLITGFVVLVASASLVTALSDRMMMVLLGGPIVAFSVASLMGRGLVLPPNPPAWVDVAIGVVAGFFGGIAGIWGPAVVAWLTARNIEKTEAIRVQGMIFLLGALTLVFAHLVSGVLNSQTIWLSVALVLPALAGMRLGQAISDRISQHAFRKATMVVLTLAGLNLLRRGLWGG